ncbi:MAG: hypothetical protein OXH52_07580 [Gammaproteobacteria bacterium]|nr:hypothetical protein [Gammaproteobacteria bacterium]
MPRAAQTRGRCGYCGRELTCSGLGRHFGSCPARRKVTEKADSGRGRPRQIHHLRVRDAYGLGYWLHLEMNGDATLFELDQYLRRIWLDCCGHMSAFRIGRAQYADPFDDPFGFNDFEPIEAEADEVFTEDLSFVHEYDFGTTTELELRVLAPRTGKPTTNHGIALMARNDPLRIPCQDCGAPASLICLDCCYQGVDDWAGHVCDDHAAAHAAHCDYGHPMAIFNSPRSGVCAYGGPAEPPY